MNQKQIPRHLEETACLQYLMQRPGKWVVLPEMGHNLNIVPRSIGKYLSYYPDIVERKVVSKFPVGCQVVYRYRGDVV